MNAWEKGQKCRYIGTKWNFSLGIVDSTQLECKRLM